MILDDAEAIALGREVVKRGQLLQLRTRLGLTVNAMAELLHTVWPTYKTWETRPVVLRAKTAARVGRFYDQATAQLEMLAEDGIHVHELVPFHIVATLLGIPQEQLLYRYRNGEFEAVDLGILGLWLYQSDLDGLKE
jgi:hypothetical protein